MTASPSSQVQDELADFINEATEMLDEAERHLLGLEKGAEFAKSYDAVFRVFHSLKGAAGMLSMHDLQGHMHQLENQYQQCKGLPSLSQKTITYFLKGVDVARQVLGGAKVPFDYQLDPEGQAAATVQVSPVPAPAAVAVAQPAPLVGELFDFCYAYLAELDEVLLAQGRSELRAEMQADFAALLARRASGRATG